MGLSLARSRRGPVSFHEFTRFLETYIRVIPCTVVSVDIVVIVIAANTCATVIPIGNSSTQSLRRLSNLFFWEATSAKICMWFHQTSSKFSGRVSAFARLYRRASQLKRTHIYTFEDLHNITALHVALSWIGRARMHTVSLIVTVMKPLLLRYVLCKCGRRY